MNGHFISFEGIDGSGKTTVIQLIAKQLQQMGIPFVQTREPGGTRLAQKIRELILDPANEEIHKATEIMLYATSRSAHVHNLIIPELAKGKIVLCDRFVDSSIAYQGYGLNHTKKEIEDIERINRIATVGLIPERTYFIDLDPAQAFQRKIAHTKEHSEDLDRIEQRDREFFNNTYNGYKEIIKSEPERFCVVDGTMSVEEVFTAVWKDLQKHLYGTTC